MNSLSTSTLGPVAFSLGLFLVMAAAFPTTPRPLGEDSTDAAPSNRPSYTTPEHIEELIKRILGLAKEMCQKSFGCDNSREVLAGNNLNLPKMEKEDGCFESGFNKETCLKKITTGLLEFQVYLEYLQNKFEGNKEHAETVLIGTKAMIQYLKTKVKNPDAVATPDPTANAILLVKLKSQGQWLQNTTIHLILRSLIHFLHSSARAIRVK
ncbi:interleukin-6 [Carlito syrichta]|uniref:Interleukin-6 n=1 Tax=Carlito syrichta TaxID=1868482 RepID=A0A1U7U6M6_CARSF|nr:interleukin-6 [Carlito syrichta]